MATAYAPPMASQVMKSGLVCSKPRGLSGASLTRRPRFVVKAVKSDKVKAPFLSQKSLPPPPPRLLPRLTRLPVASHRCSTSSPTLGRLLTPSSPSGPADKEARQQRHQEVGGEGVADEKRYQITSTNKHLIIGRGMVDDDASQWATFGERNGGLLREAQELAVFCEAEVGILVFDSAGRQLDYCSPHTSYMESDTVKKISIGAWKG